MSFSDNSKDPGSTGAAAEEDGDNQCSSRNHPDAKI